jgi:hypothetical protein
MISASRATEARGLRSRLARAGVLGLALAAVTALGLLASACGGSSGEGVARVDSSGTTTTQDSQNASSSADPTAYSACMRKNGVPKFPDPNAEGRFQIQGGPGTGIDPNSPQFKAAEKACQRFMPRGGDETLDPKEQAKNLRKALRYSACMRQKGVPNFPDPKANAEGGIELSFDGTTGIDPSSPKFKAAEEACKELAPGANGGAFSQRSAPGSQR